MTRDIGSEVAVAILSVISRGLSGGVEIGVVDGPTQIVIGPGESVALQISPNGQMPPGLCTLTGTTTKL